MQTRSNYNKATCALANKPARICYATSRDGEPYGSAQPQMTIARTGVMQPT